MSAVSEFANGVLGAPFLGTALSVLLIAVGGYLVTLLVSGIAKRVVQRLDGGHKATDFLFSEKSSESNYLARVVGKTVYWVGLAFVLMAVLDRLEFTSVSSPLQTAFSGLAFGLPSLIKGAAILVVGWLIATVAKKVVSGAWTKANLDRRLDFIAANQSTKSRAPLAGQIAFLVVLCLAIPAALNAIGVEVLGNALGNVWGELFGFIPHVLAAGIIFGVGFVVAKLLKGAVSKTLASTTVDQKVARYLPKFHVSALVGSVLFFAIMFPVTIAAVDALGISAISQPLNEMIAMVWAFVPKLVVSMLILGVFAYVAKFARSWSQETLSSMGADGWPEKLGLLSPKARTWGLSGVLSSVLGAVILWFGVSQALETLELYALQNVAAKGLAFLPTALVGAAIVVAGFYLGGLAEKMLSEKQGDRTGLFAKITIIAFAGVAAADQIGIAENFALIGFTIVLASAGLAAALAFGLGSRDVAGAFMARNFDVENMDLAKPDGVPPYTQPRGRQPRGTQAPETKL